MSPHKKIFHVLPPRYREDGRLIDYIVSIKMVGTGIKETDGTAYSWDALPSSISKTEKIKEELIVELKSITIDLEDYKNQLEEAIKKGITEEKLLEYFYNYTESDGWDGTKIEYKTIFQKNTSWPFFKRPKEKEKLFLDILPYLVNPTRYFWNEIRDRLVTYAASDTELDIEVFKILDCISFIFAKKWELGKGECASDPNPNKFIYPRLEPIEQARNLFNNAFMLALSEESKNIVDRAKSLRQRDPKKEIIKFTTPNVLFNFIEKNIRDDEQENLKTSIFLRIYSLLSERGFEIKDLIPALENKTSNEWTELFQNLCERKRTYFPAVGTYTSYDQLIGLYHEIEAQEIFGQVWEVYYGFDALVWDLQRSFESKEKYELPIEKQISQYSHEISEVLPAVKTTIDQIRSNCKNEIGFWDKLTPVTQERIIVAYFYEDHNAGGDFEPTIMKLATALENELTEQLLEILTERYPDECRDLKIWDSIKIEGVKRLLERYGSKIFRYGKASCREWVKKLDTLSKIRAHGPAHSVRGASRDGLVKFKGILFGHSSDRKSLFEEIIRLRQLLT